MSEIFVQQKAKKQAYAVETSKPNEHHLQTDDADFGQSEISEKAQYALSTVVGKRVLVGVMSFNISGKCCTPKNMTGISQCSGQGMIMAKDDSLLQSRGMYALKVGDEGQCNGVGFTSDGKPVPVTCTVCIGEHLQPKQQADTALQTAAAQASPSGKLNRFPIRLQYEDGSPVKGAQWKAVGSTSKKVLEGELDEYGCHTFELNDDTCEVTFPDFDLSLDTQPLAGTQLVEIEFNAFIHRDVTRLTQSGSTCPRTGETCWSWEPIIGRLDFLGLEFQTMFKGDCRDFGEVGTSRVAHKVHFPVSAIGNFNDSNVQIQPEIGFSHQRKRYIINTVGGKFASEWETTPPKQAENQGEYKVGNNRIEMRGEAAYPFRESAPDIDYRVSVSVIPISSSAFRFVYEGVHNLFPFYELIINRKVVWRFASPESGPDLINLNRSRDFSGQVIVELRDGTLEVETD